MLDRIVLFLSSRRNLAGSALALVGLGLFFAGLIKSFWPFIVLGLYALGYLLTPLERSDIAPAAVLDEDRIEEALERLARHLRGKLPPDILARVEGIRDSILAVLPELRTLQGIEHSYDEHVIRETALVYLPEMLGSYVRLPGDVARRHKLRDGKTAHQIVLEQLDLLDGEMKKITLALHRRDLDALQSHGQFLKEKFAENDWKLG